MTIPPAGGGALLEPGVTVDGRYVIRDLLGRGGMGAVYRADQVSVGREMALKVLAPAMATDEIAVKRFLREARVASQLSHPNTVTLYDFGKTPEGLLYIAMELIAGETLSAILKRGALPPLRAITIAAGICGSLGEAHGAGLVHRDLKPGNVIVQQRFGQPDFPRVLDFGLARPVEETDATITRTGVVCGTPAYMAPEQARAGEISAAVDIYALGCILYQSLVGRPPFGGTAVQVMVQHATESVPRADTTEPTLTDRPELVQLVADMTERDPAARPTAGQVLGRLRALIPSESGTELGVLDTITHANAPAVPGTPPRRQPPRSSALPWALAGVVVLAATAVVAWALLRDPTPQASAEPATAGQHTPTPATEPPPPDPVEPAPTPATVSAAATPPAATPGASTPSPEPAPPPAVATGPHPMIHQAEALADEMCECRDAGCMKAVMERVESFHREHRSAQVTPEATAQVTDATQRASVCVDALLGKAQTQAAATADAQALPEPPPAPAAAPVNDPTMAMVPVTSKQVEKPAPPATPAPAAEIEASTTPKTPPCPAHVTCPPHYGELVHDLLEKICAGTFGESDFEAVVSARHAGRLSQEDLLYLFNVYGSFSGYRFRRLTSFNVFFYDPQAATWLPPSCPSVIEKWRRPGQVPSRMRRHQLRLRNFWQSMK